ncbi:MAG: hypothetical protein HZB43_08985 [candidate division Zixibacteria bacterium]|nr:hypothetical protein [candidate division Zixibacteria bacterium]
MVEANLNTATIGVVDHLLNQQVDDPGPLLQLATDPALSQLKRQISFMGGDTHGEYFDTISR